MGRALRTGMKRLQALACVALFAVPLAATTATPDEVAAHVRAGIEWTQANRDLNPANAIIIYAWNEHDEGGWLQPTLGTDGKPDDARIQALAKVLHGKTNP